jgi:hypothetical protein
MKYERSNTPIIIMAKVRNDHLDHCHDVEEKVMPRDIVRVEIGI